MNKVAVITGASSGMGREFALQLANQPDVAQLWVIARREERLRALAEELSLPVRVLPLDLTRREDLEAYRALLKTEHPEISWLVNASGFCKFGDTVSVGVEENLEMIDLNVRALVGMTLLTLPFMAPGGRVVEIASVAGYQPLPYMNVYAASKAFVLHFSRALNYELADKGQDVSITALCPGWTKTEFFDVAKKSTEGRAVQNFFFACKAQNVVRGAIRAARRRREVYSYGVPNIVHRICAKIIPHRYMMAIFNRIR